ncbi:MAG: vitamin K epoxide reductase family protein, partial [Dehalococcoidia bacterium]
MRAPSRLDALLALALTGTAIAAYLAYVALAGGEPFCSGAGDCGAVQSSEYADVAGVPVAVLGLAMYLVLLGLTAARRLTSVDARLRLDVWTFAVALSGTLFSAYLTYLELFVIEAICAWCVASALVVTAIAVLSARDL